jgi:hypothetical protein
MDSAIDTIMQTMMMITCAPRSLLDKGRGIEARFSKLSILAALRSEEAESALTGESEETGTDVVDVENSPQIRRTMTLMKIVRLNLGVGSFMLMKLVFVYS